MVAGDVSVVERTKRRYAYAHGIGQTVEKRKREGREKV
jgi:hypothetical protein